MFKHFSLVLIFGLTGCGKYHPYDDAGCAAAFSAVDAKLASVQAGVTSVASLETDLAGAPIVVSQSAPTDTVLGIVYSDITNRESWCGLYDFPVAGGTISAINKHEDYITNSK